MPSIPIWSIAILITGVIFTIGCLLFSFLRYHRRARSTIDPAEYSTKKHKICPFDAKSSSPVSPSFPQCRSQTVQASYDTTNPISTSISPPPLPPKDDSPMSLPLPKLPPVTSTEEYDSCDTPLTQKNKPKATLPSSSCYRWNDSANREESSVRVSLPSPGISAKGVIGMEPGSRQLLEYDLESMFASSIVDDIEDTNNDHDHHHHHSIASLLQNNNNSDTESITAGLVHHLVRDSIVLDIDHRSFAAPSITSSVRPSLHDMASWWPIQDKITDHSQYSSEQGLTTGVTTFGATNPLSHADISVQGPMHLLSRSNFVSESMNSCCPSSKATVYTSSSNSTHSRATLNQFRIALTNEDQDQMLEMVEPGQTEQGATPTESQDATFESSNKYAVPDNELPPSMFPTNSYPNEESTPAIDTRPRSAVSTMSNTPPHNKIAPGRHIKSVPAPASATASIWSSPRNSAIGESVGIKINRVHQELQAAWHTHRLSNQYSITSNSTRSSMSQARSPPGSVNPRQLNQHLVSMSLQANGGHSQHSRPGSPNGFREEEWLAQSAAASIIEGPQPTVSFSSSTVRTMIPVNEAIEFHDGKQMTLATTIQQQQQQYQQEPQSEKTLTTAPSPKKETTATATLDQEDQEPGCVWTMRAHRQQRGAIPWNNNDLTKATVNSKTPAQRERDRYLQSLKINE